MTHRKARTKIAENSEKPQVKSVRLKDVFGSDPKRLPEFIKCNQHDMWQIAINYQFIIRFLAHLAKGAARGVTAAEKALDEIAKRMGSIRRREKVPGAYLFATHKEWTAFLNAKLAEWAVTEDLSGTRLLLAALKSSVRAAARGEPEADMALRGVVRKLEKLATEVSRTDAEAGHDPDALQVVAPSPEQLQKLFDRPS